MPFTFCHPAIVLPLAKLSKSKISMTALVIGSMSPDFEYFIRMRLEKVHGHTLSGLFYFDLPLTVILAFLFHYFVRDTLILNLPELLKKRFEPFIGLNWFAWFRTKWYIFIYSAIIGIFSHVFWDAFTHTNGFFVERLPFLQGSVEIFDHTLKKTYLAQGLSTLFGGLFIGIALIWPQQKNLSHSLLNKKILYWSLIISITCIVLIFRNVQNLGDIIATTISGGLIGLIIVPKLMRFINFKRNVN